MTTPELEAAIRAGCNGDAEFERKLQRVINIIFTHLRDHPTDAQAIHPILRVVTPIAFDHMAQFPAWIEAMQKGPMEKALLDCLDLVVRASLRAYWDSILEPKP
jgi:hypothetical protein